MENNVRHLIRSESSFTTALAIAVPSNVAVPRPVDHNIMSYTGTLLSTWKEVNRTNIQVHLFDHASPIIMVKRGQFALDNNSIRHSAAKGGGVANYQNIFIPLGGECQQ